MEDLPPRFTMFIGQIVFELLEGEVHQEMMVKLTHFIVHVVGA